MKKLTAACLIFIVSCLPALAASPVPANGVISVTGEYYLPSARSSNGANYVINIAASNVTLDLNGQVVQCTPPNPAGQSTFGIIAHGVSNPVIKNGHTLGCRQGVSVLNSTNPKIIDMKIHARKTGILGNNAVSGLVVRGVEIYDLAGATDQAYSIGIDTAGSNCTIEHNLFRNLHRQSGVPSGWAGEGVAVIFSTGSTGCTYRYNWHKNSNMSHLEIGLWVGDAVVTVEENVFTNVGRAIAASPGYDLTATDNRFLMRTAQTGSYAIGAQQGLASKNVIIGYDDPILGNIPDTDTLIFP